MDSPKPLVSICCITYNHKNYIRDCLEGFLMQKTNFPFEVLIHDDASTDGTIDILKEYQAKYPDIIKPYFEIENCYSQGKPFTVPNYSRAVGKYLAFCEGDDFWTDKNKLQMQYDFMEAHTDYSMCGTGLYLLNHIEKTYRPVAFPKSDFDGQTRELSLKILCGQHPFRNQTVFVRMQDYRAAQLDIARDKKDAPMGDLQLFFHMSLHGKLKFIRKRTATYRVSTTSVSHYDNKDKYDSFVKRCQESIVKIAINNGFTEYVTTISSCLMKNHESGRKNTTCLLKILIWCKRALLGYFSNYKKFMGMTPQDRVKFRID